MTQLETKGSKSESIILKHDWTLEEIKGLLTKPLVDLLWDSQLVHRSANPGYNVQLASLLLLRLPNLLQCFP